MNTAPCLSVIVALPRSASAVSDMLASTLRIRSLDVDVIVVLDTRRERGTAAVVRSVMDDDRRVRIIHIDRDAGRTAAVNAGLESSTATWVTVADANGIHIDGGYESMVESLESSNSDIAVGVSETLVKARRRIRRAVDGAADIAASGALLTERSGLITDDILCTKVMRRSLLKTALRDQGAWLEELLVAKAFVLAQRIDVLPRSVIFTASRPSSSRTASMSREWLIERKRIWAVLASAAPSVRTAYARELISRDVLSTASLDLLGKDQDREDAQAFILDLVRGLDASSLANLAIQRRWQLALIASGRSSLINAARQGGRPIEVDAVPDIDSAPLTSPAWVSLGLRGSEDLRTAFIERFATRTKRILAPAQSSDDGIDISVVIPTYNVGSFVDELLLSIRGAVGVRLEIIVVDDGSTDGTWDRVLAHQAADDRVRLIRSPGSGGGQARDAGIELARGDYLAFADGDDLVPPRAYAQMLDLARESGADVINGSYLKFFATSTWDAGTSFNHAYTLKAQGVTLDSHPQLSRHRAVWNRLIRRELWIKSAFPFPGVPRSNDIVAMMTVLLSARSIAVTPAQVYVYRDRPGTGSMTSAAGSTDYTVSYFSEEATCAALVQQRASQPLTREYWTMVLQSDAWNNIVKYVDRRTADPADDRRVAEQISRLLSRAPRIVFDILKPEHQAAWALAAAGRFDDARTMIRVEKSATGMTMWTLIRAISALEALPIVPRASLNTLAWKYLLRRFISDPSWRTDAFSNAVPLLQRLLTDAQMPLVVLPFSLEERLARAVLDGDTEARLEAISPEPSKTTATLLPGAPTTLAGKSKGLQPGGMARVVARKFGDRSRTRVSVGHISFREGTWSTRIDPASLPAAGVWLLEVEYEDSLGLRRATLRLDEEASTWPPSRFRRVSTARSGKNRSLVRVRDSVRQRVRRKLARAVRRFR